MSTGYDAFAIDTVVPIFDDLYYDFLTSAIERARRRIWASIFIVNPIRAQDLDRKVRGVIDTLGAKRTIGLDVRVVVGVSESTQDIQLTNEVALAYLRARGVPARAYTGAKHSTHAKYVVIDHHVCIVGSHNWSHNALSTNVEDSLLIRSPEHAHMLARQFLTTWAN